MKKFIESAETQPNKLREETEEKIEKRWNRSAWIQRGLVAGGLALGVLIGASIQKSDENSQGNETNSIAVPAVAGVVGAVVVAGHERKKTREAVNSLVDDYAEKTKDGSSLEKNEYPKYTESLSGYSTTDSILQRIGPMAASYGSFLFSSENIYHTTEKGFTLPVNVLAASMVLTGVMGTFEDAFAQNERMENARLQLDNIDRSNAVFEQ